MDCVCGKPGHIEVSGRNARIEFLKNKYLKTKKNQDLEDLLDAYSDEESYQCEDCSVCAICQSNIDVSNCLACKCRVCYGCSQVSASNMTIQERKEYGLSTNNKLCPRCVPNRQVNSRILYHGI